MEASNTFTKFATDEYFYSDSDTEQDMDDTLKAVTEVKTAFKLGHAVGTQDTNTHMLAQNNLCPNELQHTAVKLAEEMSTSINSAKEQTRYAQRYTEHVLDTLDIVRAANARLVKRVQQMDQYVKTQELRWAGILERVRIQEHIIKVLTEKINAESSQE